MNNITETSPQNDFLSDSRYLQSVKAIPYHNQILEDVFGAHQIKRAPDYKRPEDYERAIYMDMHHGIDISCLTQKNQLITVSEKCLSHKYSDRNTITIEYWQDARRFIRGDYFKCTAQFYLVSYLDESGHGLSKWVLLNLGALRVADVDDLLTWREYNNNERGRASLFTINCTRINEVCPHAIVAQHGFLGDNK